MTAHRPLRRGVLGGTRRFAVGSDSCAHDGVYIDPCVPTVCGFPAAELRKAAPVAMPRALDAELHAIRQSSTPSVRTSLPTTLLYADRVRFHLPLPLGACVLVWSASAVGGFPATDCHWALALFLWLGICRPYAVSPPLTLGAFALATGRLSVSALVCLVSKLRKAAPVAMPRALDAELHAIRQDIPPDSHVVDPHTPVAGPLRPCTEF